MDPLHAVGCRFEWDVTNKGWTVVWAAAELVDTVFIFEATDLSDGRVEYLLQSWCGCWKRDFFKSCCRRICGAIWTSFVFTHGGDVHTISPLRFSCDGNSEDHALVPQTFPGMLYRGVFPPPSPLHWGSLHNVYLKGFGLDDPYVGIHGVERDNSQNC